MTTRMAAYLKLSLLEWSNFWRLNRCLIKDHRNSSKVGAFKGKVSHVPGHTELISKAPVMTTDSKNSCIHCTAYTWPLATCTFSWSENLSFVGRDLRLTNRFKQWWKNIFMTVKTFFFDDIEMLPKHCIKCVELRREYIENKGQSFFFHHSSSLRPDTYGP